MEHFDVALLTANHDSWPRQINQRLGQAAPSRLWTIGNQAIFTMHKIGLLCSVDCSADAPGSARNALEKLFVTRPAFMSGFHSPVEKEWLRVLLEARQNIIISVARSLTKLRVPAQWQESLDSDRLLIVSRFDGARRADKETARRRNELVAALADEALVISRPGGSIERISQMISGWGIPRVALQSEREE